MKDKYVIVDKDGNGMEQNTEGSFVKNTNHPTLFDNPVKGKSCVLYYDYLVDQYYNHDNAVISDEKFDAYANALGRINELENSASNSLQKLPHSFNVNSLAKVHSVNNEMKMWMDKINQIKNNTKFDLEWKADGITVVIYINHFPNRKIVILTRGGGYEGEDVTHNVLQSPDIQKLLTKVKNSENQLIIRAEAVIYEDDFKKYGQMYSDKRAMSSGAVRNKNDDLAKYIHLHTHGIVGTNNPSYATELLKDVDIPNLIIAENLTEDEIIDKMNSINKSDAQKLQFATDGLVVKVWDGYLRKKLGETEHHPKWAMAYKFANESTVGIVDHIEWQLGKTGKYSPVIHLKEAIQFGGRSINKVSGGSYRLMQEYRVIPDAEITIELANEVIPKITGNINPDLNAIISIPDDAYIDGAHLYKSDFQPSVLDKAEESLALMGMKGFKWGKIQKLIQAGLLHDNGVPVPVQATKLTFEDIAHIPGLGVKTAQNFIDSIKKAQDGLPYQVVLVMMGIKGLAWKAADAITIATKNQTIDELPMKFKKFMPAIENNDLKEQLENANYKIIFK